jgi:hypothetical protein
VINVAENLIVSLSSVSAFYKVLSSSLGFELEKLFDIDLPFWISFFLRIWPDISNVVIFVSQRSNLSLSSWNCDFLWYISPFQIGVILFSSEADQTHCFMDLFQWLLYALRCLRYLVTYFPSISVDEIERINSCSKLSKSQTFSESRDMTIERLSSWF